ncbi:peptidase [Pontibacillus halophilus JSM 076056 = DSM 19796]|uniref:Peptidase n=2 Tax=Pontibacillus TaxID=289201 RepID=A0A0A5GD03_9BACI|nr:class D sortase [Pontibacillus halophilus]KGX91086.1 peptidase [Pontibacillus halophilus JSM 076056 = DSM 19796]
MMTGLVVAGYQYWIWSQARSSAETLTQDEVEEYEALKEQKHLSSTAITTQEPSYIEERDYSEGEKVGALIIPKLEENNHFSVYWGTDENTLQAGVGMFDSDLTTTPLGRKHTVLSGHRDTVFHNLGKLGEGDELMVEFDGNLYVYEIQTTWITDAEDRSVIVDKESATLTLTTCYPFDFFGNAPDRYIVQSKLTSIYPIPD